jgi:geranylgeranyl diphosphate synthase type I
MLSHHLGWEPPQGMGKPPAASMVKPAATPAVERAATPAGKPAISPAGKLVRPRLCLLSCRAVGGDAFAAVPAAAAVELVHDFSLIHDDIEDRDDLRRGRPTVWKLWGEAQGINAGDCLYSLAYAVLGEGDDAAAETTRRLRAVAVLSEACVRLCEGQAHDIALQSQQDISETEYLDMVARKTGAIMAAAAQMGALAGGASEAQGGAFRQFGSELGTAFQIRDDVLGIWGDPDKTGKPVGSDLSRKRCSYPVIWGLAQARGQDRDAILAARSESSPAALAGAASALERIGARARAEHLAAEIHRRAWAALEGLKLKPRAAQELRQLTEFLTSREQ